MDFRYRSWRWDRVMSGFWTLTVSLNIAWVPSMKEFYNSATRKQTKKTDESSWQAIKIFSYLAGWKRETRYYLVFRHHSTPAYGAKNWALRTQPKSTPHTSSIIRSALNLGWNCCFDGRPEVRYFLSKTSKYLLDRRNYTIVLTTWCYRRKHQRYKYKDVYAPPSDFIRSYF